MKPLKKEIRELEERRIREALAKAGYNKTNAAELLGMHRTTLVESLRRLGMKEFILPYRKGRQSQ